MGDGLWCGIWATRTWAQGDAAAAGQSPVFCGHGLDGPPKKHSGRGHAAGN